MENGLHHSNETSDMAQIVRGDRLVEATPETVRELAESAMLLSQGARRAIEMRRDDHGGTDRAVPVTPAAAKARPS